MLKSHLKELLDKRNITIRVFAERIDYRFESVRQLYHGTMKRLPADLIERTCRELDCDIDDLLTIEPDSDEGSQEDNT